MFLCVELAIFYVVFMKVIAQQPGAVPPTRLLPRDLIVVTPPLLFLFFCFERCTYSGLMKWQTALHCSVFVSCCLWHS